MLPPRQAFGLVEPVAQDIGGHIGENGNAHVGVGGDPVVLVDRPVEAQHAFISHDAFALHHDVVAGLGVEVVLVLARQQHVMADDG
ncbi:hypothetical protein D9M68_903820 [compost metagenome]